jgi:hypothetical protein
MPLRHLLYDSQVLPAERRDHIHRPDSRIASAFSTRPSLAGTSARPSARNNVGSICSNSLGRPLQGRLHHRRRPALWPRRSGTACPGSYPVARSTTFDHFGQTFGTRHLVKRNRIADTRLVQAVLPQAMNF